MTETRKIISKVLLSGALKAQTGLHVGGNSVGMAIGGADSVVVRNPLTNDPYIPGSSLRGKLRSLLERVRGAEDTNDNPEGGFSLSRKGAALAGVKAETSLGQLFGVSASETNKEPTRLIVRDCPLTQESREALLGAPNTDMPMTEVKTEVWIDRITSAANPRQIERVPAGTEFSFEFILTLMEGDDRNHYLDLLFEGLRLIQADTLGGSGSRGYGQVTFQVARLEERRAEDYKSGNPAAPVAGYPIPPEFQGQVESQEQAA